MSVQQDGSPDDRTSSGPPPVTLIRTARGWSVVTPKGSVHAGDLVEGLSLADVIAEEFGGPVEPDRSARRSARGPGQADEPAEDRTDARISALERTVAQLEHALAARVSTERAIGVLAERHRVPPRTAFESLRREARSSGRPVAELARSVLAGMERPEPGAAADAPAGSVGAVAGAAEPSVAPAPRAAAAPSGAPAQHTGPGIAAADGRR